MFFLKRLLFLTTSCLVFSMCFSVLYGSDRVESVAKDHHNGGRYEDLVDFLEEEKEKSDLSDEALAYLSIGKYKVAEEQIIGDCGDLDLIYLSELKTARDDFPKSLCEEEDYFKTEYDKMHDGLLDHRFNNNVNCYEKDKANCKGVVENLNSMDVSNWSDAGAKETLVKILRDCASDDSSGLTEEKRKEFTERANELAPPEADKLRRDCDILYNKLSDDDRKDLTKAQPALDCYIGKIEEINGQIDSEDNDDKKAKLQNISYFLQNDTCQYLVAIEDLEKINDGIAYCKAAYGFDNDNDKYANDLVFANYKKFEALGDSEYSDKYKLLYEEVYPNIDLITDDDLKETISNNVEEFVKSYISHIRSLTNWEQELNLLQILYMQLSILDPSSEIVAANLCKLNHMETPDSEELNECLKDAESLLGN